MDYKSRLEKFQQILAGAADVAFFPISADLQYLTGVPRDVPNYGAVLHPGGWLEGAWVSANSDTVLALPRMTAEFGGLSSLPNVQIRVLGDWDDPAQMVRDILKTLNVSGKSHPRVAISDRTQGETIVHLQKILPDAVFVSATDLLRPLRRIKSEEEIAVMREAGKITEAAFADVLKNLKLGMSELDVIAEVDYQLWKHGAVGPSFTTSMYNSGPHYRLIFGEREKKWHRKLEAPVSLLFDFGAVHEGYCYDFGRTVAFGQPDKQFQQVYKLIMDAQAAGIAALKAGEATTTQVDAAARKVITDAGYGEAFRHRLGHAIGMDVHEPPFLTAGDETTVQEGMLFTVEPSITLFDQFSSRVEDVVVVRKGGGEPLTRGFQELIVIE
ncbi:MAG: Xaa-Pro peptidase family protein [Anaerolineae bacterium]